MGRVRDDLVFAMRQLRRSPALSLGVAITIALGVGANATMFSVADRILLSPPPHIRSPDEVKRLLVERTFATRTSLSASIAHPDFRDWEAAQSFAAIASFGRESLTLGRGEAAKDARVVFVSGSFFPLLGTTPHRGRLIAPADDELGASPVAVLGYGFWQREFGGADDIIGRTLDLGPDRVTVAGIAPQGFTGVDLQPVDVWMPLHTHYEAEHWEDRRGYYWTQAIGRLADGVTAGAAAAEATTLHRAGRAEETNYDPRAIVRVTSLIVARGPRASNESIVAQWLGGVSLLVLLIACSNVANLLLAHGTRRRREIAVRLALGVSGGRLMRQLLVEAALLGLLAAGGALALAKIGGDLVGGVLMPNVDWSLGVINGRVMLFTVGVALSTGLLAGMLPAVQSSRVDLMSGLKGSRAGTATRRSRIRAGLLVGQAALSVVLLVGAGLFVQSLRRVVSLDLGLEPKRLVVVNLEPEDGVGDNERIQIFENALQHLRSLEMVETASAVQTVPFRSSISEALRAEGYDSIPRLASGRRGAYVNVATPGFFRTTGIRILQGRAFSATDARNAPNVAVIGATMSRHLWPDGDALGKCLYVGGDDVPCTSIVGIAEDARRQRVVEEPQLMYYVPGEQYFDGFEPRAILARTTSDGPEVRTTLQRRLYSAIPDLRFVRVDEIASYMAPQLRSWRLGATVFTAFGILALAVAAVGLYSVLSFEVVQRRGEMAVRAALGATAGRLVRSVVADGVKFVSTGVALGGVAAFFGSRALAPLLYETSPRDPAIYASVAVLMIGVAVVASLLPALRTTRVPPTEALKAD